MTGRRWRHLTWRVAGLGVLALMTLGLSGCLVIRSEVTTQLNTVGNVRVDTTFCSSDNSIASTCPDLGAGGVAASGTGQAMVAYRIPVGATAPTTITSVSTLVTVTQNASYSSELTRRFPPPATQKWVGYVSNPQTFNTAGVLAFELLPEFTLPGAADGGPFVTPFLYRTVSGIRRAEPPALTTRPVVCGATTTDIFSDLWDFGGGPVPTTTCFDSPSVATIPTNVTRSTRDLGVIAGGSSATTAPGATAQLPFTLKYSGTAIAGANFSITASTTLPGAVPQPSLGNLAPPTDSSTQAFVNVLVPAGATPGTYDVTLTASLANGQTRIGVGKLTVPSPPPPPPPPPPPAAAGGGGRPEFFTPHGAPFEDGSVQGDSAEHQIQHADRSDGRALPGQGQEAPCLEEDHVEVARPNNDHPQEREVQSRRGQGRDLGPGLQVCEVGQAEVARAR